MNAFSYKIKRQDNFSISRMDLLKRLLTIYLKSIFVGYKTWLDLSPGNLITYDK